MKSYKLLDYLYRKVAQLENSRDQRAYKQCVRALKFIEEELAKYANVKKSESGKWNNEVFFGSKHEKNKKAAKSV